LLLSSIKEPKIVDAVVFRAGVRLLDEVWQGDESHDDCNEENGERETHTHTAIQILFALPQGKLNTANSNWLHFEIHDKTVMVPSREIHVMLV